LERLYDQCRWAEGPVWFNDGGYLLWSDIPNQRILRWTPEQGVSVYRHASNFANGNTRDVQGRLITCEHGTRRVTRTEPDGSITVLAERWKDDALIRRTMWWCIAMAASGSPTRPTESSATTRALRLTLSRRVAMSTALTPRSCKG
jgi:hypothetical protein